MKKIKQKLMDKTGVAHLYELEPDNFKPDNFDVADKANHAGDRE